ncbi:MAG: Ig-like domain-containing protein [Verrucomicrobiales bacterium]
MKLNIYIASAAQAAILTSISAHADLVVYEGFDYTEGDPIWDKSGGLGWEGSWAGTDTDERGTPAVGAGLSFGALEVTGGSYLRPQRYGAAESSRTLSFESQIALTTDDTSIWFSVLMKANPGGTTGGFAANSHGAIVFGDTALTTANPATTPPTIGDGGNAFGVGFDGNGSATADIGLHGVSYSDGVVNAGTADRILIGEETTMIVGQITWSATGSNDILNLYHITDPSAELPEPFTTMEADFDQSIFNTVAIAQGQTEIFDEIRFGESLEDVVLLDTTPPQLVSTVPTDGEGSAALNTNFVATFDEAISLGEVGNVTITNLTQSTSTVISLPGPDEDGTLTVSGNELIIDPTANLASFDEYAIQIDSTVVTDVGGNAFAGISDNTTWSFYAEFFDTYPPTPDPMSFEAAPTAISSTEITMTATTAIDGNGVEYLFTNTTLGTDSGWQTSPSWTDTGLTPDSSYSYTVTAREATGDQLETESSAEASTETFPPTSGDEILATVFPGRSVDGLTATVTDYTTNGIANPGALTAESIPDSTITVVELFDSEDAQNYFAPRTNNNSAHWRVDIPLVVDSEPIALGDIELYMQSFSSSGGKKSTQSIYLDHYVTVELIDASSSSIASQQIQATADSQFDWIGTFDFANGIDLSAETSYTLRILVSGLDPTTPAHSGNYVGIDAIRILEASESGTSSPFDDWLATHFPGEDDETIVGPAADPDMDGIDNLTEYGLNSDPNNSSDRPEILVSSDGTDVSLHFTKVAAATDINYILEWSTDLSEWFTDGITQVTDPDPATDADYPVIKASLAKDTDTAKFLRIRIEQE